MNTWIRVGLMALLVAVLLVAFGGEDVRQAGIAVGVIGVLLLVVGLATGGWRSKDQTT